MAGTRFVCLLAASLLVPALVAVPVTDAHAEPPAAHGERVGETYANGKNDHDTMNVPPGRGAYTALHNIEIILADNSVVTIGDDFTLHQNQQRFVDLPGSRRIIERVEFFYGNVGSSQNARVELWGRR